MMTGVAIIVRGPSHDFPGAGLFVVVVIVLIVLIFFRVYGRGGPSRRRAMRRPGRPAGHRTRPRKR